ncbi:hypothetical protein NFJ02_01g40730 [Pycnococcus provasolii]
MDLIFVGSSRQHHEPHDHAIHQHRPRAALAERGAAHNAPLYSLFGLRTAGSTSSARATMSNAAIHPVKIPLPQSYQKTRENDMACTDRRASSLIKSISR